MIPFPILMLFIPSINAQVSSLSPSSDLEDVMADSTEMLASVFSTMFQDKCYVILITDGSVSHHTILKMKTLHSRWGVGVFEVSDGSQYTNHTQEQLNMVLSKARKMRRLSWCVIVVAVSDDPQFYNMFAKSSLKTRFLAGSTKLLLITRMPRDKLEDLLSSHWTYKLMNTMALNIKKTSQTKSLLTYLPYSPDGTQVLEIASWTPHTGITYKFNLTLFPEKYINFYDATVNISALTYEPYWKTTVTGNTTIYSGINFNLLDTLCQSLHFSFRNLPAKNWAELEDMQEYREIFLIPVVYSVLPNRLLRWDYTIFFEQSGLFFVMATPDITPNWLNFYYPLSGQVWIGIILSTIVVCFILVQITSSDMWSSVHGELSSGSVVVETVGSLLGQGLYGRISTSHNNHTLVGTWLLFGVVIGTAYRSSLIASLTLPTLPTRPETVDELVTVVNNLTMENWGSYWKEFFSTSKSPAYQSVGQLMHLGGQLMDGLNDAIKTKKQAHIGGEMNLRLTVSNQFARLDGTSPLYLGRESMYKILYGWPITHDAPFKPAMDSVLRRIVEGGLYEQWKKEEMAAAGQETRMKKREELRKLQQEGDTQVENKTSDIRSLTLIHIQGPLLLLLLGLSLGSIFFIVEKLLKKFTT